MKTAKLKIIYSEEFDIQRVKKTLSKIDWFIENKYNYKKFPLPKALDKEKLQSYSESDIKEAVRAEYTDVLYKECEKTLIDNWAKVFGELEQAFVKSGLSCRDKYIIYLTKYGTGGSYNLPNTVVINIVSSARERVLSVIIHEIVHLAIEKQIVKYKITQWQKEVIVDSFLNKVYPGMLKQQNYPFDMSETQKIFEKYYPDAELIMSNISKLE